MCPGYAGATNWFAPSYNESTRFVYFMALEQCETYFSKPQPQRFKEGEMYYSSGVKRIAGKTRRRFWWRTTWTRDAIAWKYPQVGRDAPRAAP